MIGIIDYGLGNLGSICNMLKKIGASFEVVATPTAVELMEKLILPGVGAFDKGMENLRSQNLVEAITKKAHEQKTPILGICLGMQLLAKASEEGASPGLGLINAVSKKFVPRPGLKIPHMGWNTVTPTKDSIFFSSFPEFRFYFVHSFHVVCSEESDILCKTTHGIPFVSAFQRENVVGVQFHPEKSHRFGMHLLKNFVENFQC